MHAYLVFWNRNLQMISIDFDWKFSLTFYRLDCICREYSIFLFSLYFWHLEYLCDCTRSIFFPIFNWIVENRKLNWVFRVFGLNAISFSILFVSEPVKSIDIYFQCCSGINAVRSKLHQPWSHASRSAAANREWTHTFLDLKQTWEKQKKTPSSTYWIHFHFKALTSTSNSMCSTLHHCHTGHKM